ncbi:MAG: hypothetical protein ACK5NK_02880 [Niabella sp.]
MNFFQIFIIVNLLVIHQCNGLNNHTFYKQDTIKDNTLYEGSIALNFQTINLNSASETNDVILNRNRTMYLYNNFLIDVDIRFNFNDGEFINSDTASYTLYNLDKQEYFQFEKLSIGAKILSKGLMSNRGSFSKAVEYDPLNNFPDSMLQLKDTIISKSKYQVVTLLVNSMEEDSMYINYAKKVKFWINPAVVKFPLQLSYFLSEKSKMHLFLEENYLWQMEIQFL